MIFNPQDKAEILTAISKRPNLSAAMIGEKVQLMDDALRQVGALTAEHDAFRSRIRRRAIAFCAVVVIAAAVTASFMA